MIDDREDGEGERHADQVEGCGRRVGEGGFDEDEGRSPDGDDEQHQEVGSGLHLQGLFQV